MEVNKIYQGNCLELMKQLKDKSVDMILCDLPYGTTACKWDSVIPFEPLWEQYKRIMKLNGAIVLYGSEPFSSYLRMGAIDLYKYDWIWYKNMPTGFTQAKNKPLKDYENIMVFSKGTTVHASQSSNRMIYNPQGLEDTVINKSNAKKFGNLNGKRPSHQESYIQTKKGYPRMVLSGFPLDNSKLHPTQKPVTLCEYLIKTYTNQGDLVLDNCIGSGTTAIAALNTGRNFIGMELDQKYYELAVNRVEKHRITLENNQLLQDATENT